MVLAHAFGERYALPLPLAWFLTGGALAVLLSFLLVGRSAGREGPGTPPADQVRPDAPPRWPGALGVLLLVALAACGLYGTQEPAENLLPTVFWLLVWIAVPLSCGLLGDWTRPVNPFAALARLADRPRLRDRLLGGAEPLRWPAWLGWWPTALAFFVLTWAELVVNRYAVVPANTASGLLAYAILCLAGGLVYGPAFIARGEVFAVLFATWGRLGFWRFGASGRRGPGGGLAAPFDPHPSRLAFVLMLLIGVTFDGLLATPGWGRLERFLLGNRVLQPGWPAAWRTVALLLVSAILAGVLGGFAALSGRLAGGRTGRGGLADLLPSLLPIAFGYLLAHNLQYLLVNGQLVAPLLGNPPGNPGWPVHLPYPFDEDFHPDVRVLPSAAYWYVSVSTIVAVHVVAVVVAHGHLRRRAVSPRRARAGEYPWLAVMVAYTALSLWLLAQPLVTEGPAPGSSGR